MIGDSELNVLVNALAFGVWTAVLVFRVAWERGQRIAWSRLIAVDFLVWFVTLMSLLTAFTYPDSAHMTRLLADARAMAITLVGIVLLISRPRQMT